MYWNVQLIVWKKSIVESAMQPKHTSMITTQRENMYKLFQKHFNNSFKSHRDVRKHIYHSSYWLSDCLSVIQKQIIKYVMTMYLIWITSQDCCKKSYSAWAVKLIILQKPQRNQWNLFQQIKLSLNLLNITI